MARLKEYLEKLNENTLRLTDLVGIDQTDIQNLLVAVREVIEEHATKTSANSVKFAIVEEMLRQVRPIEELCWIFGDGVNQAADFFSDATSIPSRNVTPLTTFGN